MTVRELLELDIAFQERVADDALLRVKRSKLGFRMGHSLISKEYFIDRVILKKIIDSNKVLSKTAKVRVPAWTTESSFNEFIAKIKMICLN